MVSLTHAGDLPQGAVAQSARIAFRFLLVVVVVLAGGWAVSNVRQVPPESRAVVYRLGSFSREAGAGLLLAWPRPIERVILIPAAERQIAFPLPRFAAEGEGAPEIKLMSDADARENGGFLLTGDAGVVHFEATLHYRIADARRYTLQAEHVAPALERFFAASAIEIAASRDLDGILVARPERADGEANADAAALREQLRGALVEQMNRRLAALESGDDGLGVTVERVDLTASLPPEAKDAFDFVLRASQDADKTIADARTTAERTLQDARQEHDKILSNATALASEMVTQATTKTAAIAALAASTNLTGPALLDQIYRQRIVPLIKRAGNLTAIDARNGMHILLPGGSPEQNR